MSAPGRMGSLSHVKTPARAHLLVALTILAATALSLGAATRKSVTIDEFQALPHGLYLWRTGDFRLATGNPPLSQLLPALPVLAMRPALSVASFPAFETTWDAGNGFARDNPVRYASFFQLARAVSALVFALTCWLVSRLANRLYGPAASVLATAMAAFSPNLLAHGSLVTPDIYVTAAMLASVWAFLGYLERPSVRSGALLGAVIAVTALSKFTGFLLGLLLLALLAVVWRRRAARPGAKRVTQSGLAALLAFGFVLNAGYGFQGTFSSPSDLALQSEGMRAASALLPDAVPIPLPAPLLSGLDAQLAERGYDAYLWGRFNQEGFRLYYVVALAAKVPWWVWPLALLAIAARPRLTRSEWILVAVTVLLTLFFSLARHKNIGVRYVLFVEPFVAIWIGRILWDGARRELRRRLGAAAVLSAAALVLVAVRTWPDYLAYFTAAAGGSEGGHAVLLDSNLDWGQDLTTLARYMRREGIASVDLAAATRVDPRLYGIDYRHLGGRERQRFAVVSANLLWGRMYFVNGTSLWPQDRDTYAAFRSLEPVAVLGHTMYVFDLARP